MRAVYQVCRSAVRGLLVPPALTARAVSDAARDGRAGCAVPRLRVAAARVSTGERVHARTRVR